MEMRIIKEAIDKTNSMSQASRVLKISYKKFKKYAILYNLWKPNQGLKNGSKIKIDLEDVFSGKKTMRNHNLKKRLIEGGYLINKCCKCENDGVWEGRKLVLELDHINGIGNDNKLSNLRLLCPNCHSQTSTFRGRNIKKDNKKYSDREFEISVKNSFTISEVCDRLGIVSKGGNYKTIENKMIDMKLSLKKESDIYSDINRKFGIEENLRKGDDENKKMDKICKCGTLINKHSKQCKKCSQLSQRRSIRPSYNELIEEVSLLGYSGTGRKYKVSDNSIRKWIKNYETHEEIENEK